MKGDFVKVDADRGEDLGIVCGKISCSDFKEEKPTAGFRGRGFSVIQGCSVVLTTNISFTSDLILNGFRRK